MISILRRGAWLLALFMGISAPAAACGIVYGKDWALKMEAPTGWELACGKRAMRGTSATMWRSSQSAATANTYIYVTVTNGNRPKTLERFITADRVDYMARSPNMTVEQVKTGKNAQGFAYTVMHYGHVSGDREELVAYMEGQTAYYIVVMTTTSTGELERNRPDFMRYLDSLIPMTLTVENADAASAKN